MSYSSSRISDTVDFQLAMAKGEVAGNISINKFGLNQDLDIGSEDLWASGGTYVQATVAATLSIVSSSAADTSAGTGARTISINGLDSNYADVTETITLDGATPVVTSSLWWFVNKIIVLTAGTGDTNAGTISVTSTGAGTPIMATVVIGKGQSQSAIYQVPSGYTGYLFQYLGGFQIAIGATSAIDIELYIKPFGGVLNLQGTIALMSGSSSFAQRDYLIPLEATQKSIVKLRATTDTNNCEVHGSFDLILTKNL